MSIAARDDTMRASDTPSEVNEVLDRCQRSKGLTRDQWDVAHYIMVKSDCNQATELPNRRLTYNHPDRSATKPSMPSQNERRVGVRRVNARHDTGGVLGKFKKEVTEIEHRPDLSHSQKISRITHMACATCAGIAIQPIPFADIFVLTPIQAYFASRIAAIYGVPVSKSQAEDWVKEIVGIVGMGFMAQQLAIGVWKIVTFGMGGFLTIPLVYALTYAIMKVADAYFSAKARNESISEERLKQIWKNAKKEGKRKGENCDWRDCE